MFKRSKSNNNNNTTAGGVGVGGQGTAANNASTKKLNFTVVIHELILPIFVDANYVSPKNRKKNNNNSDENKIPIRTTNALRAIAWYRGNKKSGVTRSIVAKPYQIDGANSSFEEEEEAAEEKKWEKHDFENESFQFEATMTGNKKKSLRFLILEANKNEAEAPKEGVKKVAGMHVGTVDCDLSNFLKPERRGGRMGAKVTVEVELEQNFLKGKGKSVLNYSKTPRGGRARMTMTIRHDREDSTEGSAFAAAAEGGSESISNNRFSRIKQEHQAASTSRENTLNSNNNSTDGSSGDQDNRPISTFSVADVVKPGQRPVGNVSANRMPLAKASSSLHASRFGAGGAAGIVANTARPAMSSENDAMMMDASKSTAKMFARNRFENVPSNAHEQLQADEADEDGEWNPFSSKHEHQKHQQPKEERERTEEEDWNPFARRGNGVSTGNLGASISAADKSETPRMGNSNAQDNTYKNNDNKEVNSDGFLLDSDLETEDDDEFDTDEDNEEEEEEEEEEEFDDIDDALTHRTFQNDETYDDDDDRCTTPPLTPGPTRPPPTPPHRKTSYAGSSVDHRSELRDREDFASHGVPNAAGGPMFVDKSPEFRRRSLKFRTDKQLFADDVLESKGSPPFRNARTNSLLVDVSLDSNGNDLRGRSLNNSMDRSRGDFDWSSIPMPQAAAESLLLQSQRQNNINNATSHTARSDAPSSPTKNSELSMVERISQDWDLEYRAGIRVSSDGNRSEGVRSSLMNAGSQKTTRTSIDHKSAAQQLEQELEVVKTRYEHEISELKDDLSEEQQKNQRISEQLERAKKSLDETKLELGATQVSHARLEEENEKLKNLAQTLKQNVAAAQSRRSNDESADIAAAQSSLKVASLERDKARNEINQLRQVIETLRTDLSNEKARTSLEFAMRKSSLGDDQSDVIMGEARHAYSSTSGNDSDGDMIPPWAKRSATVVTKFDRLKSTRAIVDEDSTDDEETDEEEVEDDNDLKAKVVSHDEQGEGLDHHHTLTRTKTTTTTVTEYGALIEAALVRTPQTTENFVVAKALFAYAFQDDEASRDERCYRVLDAFSGCIRGYAFDEPKQLVAIWVQIAAFARGLKSKGNTLSTAWEDARKLRDETFTFAFEAVWRRAIYPSIMCTSDDECAAESLEKRNELKGDGERVGRVYVRALDRAAILLGVNETANQAPGLAVANAAILRAILSRLDNALVGTVLSMEDNTSDIVDHIEDIANLVPGKGVVSFSAGAHLKQCVSLVSRWSESIGGMSTSNNATPFVALSNSRCLADAMMVPRVNLMDESVRSGIQGQLTNVMISKILEKRVKCELDDDRVDPNTAAAIAECVIRLSKEDAEEASKKTKTPTTINASSFLDFNADKIGADQVWDERQFLDNESRDALERAKASSFPQFADRWEHHPRQQQEEQNM